jgi:hypothetical protein
MKFNGMSIADATDTTEEIMWMMIDSGLARETEVYDKQYLKWLSRDEVEKYHEIMEGTWAYDVTGFSPKGRELFESIYNKLRGEEE